MDSQLRDDEERPQAAGRRLAPSFLPRAAVLELTYRCNHACIFCSCPWFAPDRPYDIWPELTVEQWKQTITMLCSKGVSDLAFTGGEPLLKAGLADIIAHAAACRCQRPAWGPRRLDTPPGPPNLSLLSNGRAMNRSVLALCRKHNVRLSMSLPGLASFPEHTGGGNADTVLQWFREASAMGVRTTVGVTVTRRNLGELYETVAAGLLAGADTLLLNRFLPGGRGLGHIPELTLSRAEVVSMLATAEEVLQVANRYGSVGTELPLCAIDPTRYTHLVVGARCSAANSFFAIDPSGYVRVCNHSPVRLQHVTQIESLRTNDYWRTFALRRFHTEPCSGCQLGAICDGGCREAAHIVHGRLNGPDPALDLTPLPNRPPRRG